ncbi:MAG: acyltransferase [Suilimivivens sp.]
MNKRNINLDLIKCIACLGVVGLHSVGMINYTIYYLCDLGVPLFFMANGYLMFSRDKIDYAYAFRKIFSLLKIVVLWNLLIALPVLIFRHKFVNPVRLCLESIFQKGYLWHFWFFGSLMIIYLILPLLHKIFKKAHLLHIITCLILMLICITFSLLSIYKGYSIQMFIPQTLRLWTWLFFFLFGGLCADAHIKVSIRLHAVLALMFTVISNIAQKKFGLYLIHNRLADLFYDNITSLLFYTVLFTFLLRIPIKSTTTRIISVLTNLTMGIFIIHPILLAGINSFYTPLDTFSAILFWLCLTIASGATTYILLKIPYVRELVKL